MGVAPACGWGRVCVGCWAACGQLVKLKVWDLLNSMGFLYKYTSWTNLRGQLFLRFYGFYAVVLVLSCSFFRLDSTEDSHGTIRLVKQCKRLWVTSYRLLMQQ